ncbi:MAG: methyltransferase domain-containing protein [Planctomycetes bacterium]|nr:methyltransferase domain-containing protein [Planctomycetota bacterium]NOG53891.1 methyltransferase domain-containing protein [Planctomycetota bacterium]
MTQPQQHEPTRWTRERLLAISSSYQKACVLTAAADLDLFAQIGSDAVTAESLAESAHLDARAVAVILDALTAIGLLERTGCEYRNHPDVAASLTHDGPGGVRAIVRHHGSCMRRWAQLAHVARTGHCAERVPSVRGPEADHESFILAMDNVNAPIAPMVLDDLEPLAGTCLLDVGGGSGTWMKAFLERHPQATGMIFDLPEVIPMAQTRMDNTGLSERVRCVAGNYLTDPIPSGSDLALLSAVIHQNSRAQIRTLFANVAGALNPGGRILIRDVIMKPDRIEPEYGALFAVNMLVSTAGGGTYTFDEISDDLTEAGFKGIEVAREDTNMNSVVSAHI